MKQAQTEQGFNYKVAGHSQQEPLVLLPGYASDHSLWGKIAELLAEKYYLILIDHRGIGLNAHLAPEGQPMQLIQDITTVLAAENISSAHIVGHSMGGYLAQLFAYHYSELTKSLVLLSSYCKSLSNQLWGYQAAMQLIRAGVERKTLIINSMPWLYSSDYMNDEQHCLAHIARMENRLYPLAVETIFAQIEFMQQFDLSAIANQIKAKTLIIGGNEDRIIPEPYFHELAKLLPLAHLEILSAVGHMPHLERTQKVAELICDFCV